MSAAQSKLGLIRVELDGRTFRVHVMPLTRAVDRIEQSVTTHRAGGTGFTWRKLPINSPLARAALAKAQEAAS